MDRRTCLATVGACAATYLAAPAWASEPYPTRPVSLIVPTGPGGGYDQVARCLERTLGKQLGASVVVVNRPGAGSLVGTLSAITAPPDGYTLLMGGLSNVIFNAALYKKPGYDAPKDLVPVGLVAQTPYLLVGRNGLPASVAELVRQLREKPDRFTIGHAGGGSGQQVLATAFVRQLGVDIQQVAYKSAQAVYADLLGDRVDLCFDTLPSARRFVDTQQARALLVTSALRDPLLPNVPSAAEVGLPGVEMTSWFGMFAHSKTSPEVLDKLRRALLSTMNGSDLRKALNTAGFEQMPAASLAETEQFVAAQYARWTKLIAQSGITID